MSFDSWNIDWIEIQFEHFEIVHRFVFRWILRMRRFIDDQNLIRFIINHIRSFRILFFPGFSFGSINDYLLSFRILFIVLNTIRFRRRFRWLKPNILVTDFCWFWFILDFEVFFSYNFRRDWVSRRWTLIYDWCEIIRLFLDVVCFWFVYIWPLDQ